MKIAIIGDYHISTKWIGDLSIIDQSKRLADRLVEYCKSHDIHYLFIAGDIVDKAIDRPEIVHALNYIFGKFSAYFTAVYYILGQHDMSVNAVGEIRDVDTIVTVLDYPNIYYANGQILTLGKTKIGMANFSRNSAYKLPEYVDLYITHFTISNRFGQTIDQSKFGDMIAGDIHHKVNIGNMHSIGSFQQQSISKDSEWNNVCVYDCDTHEFSHENIGGGLILRNSEVHSGLVDGIWYELKRTPAVVENQPAVDKFADDNYLKIVEKVRDFMIEKNLELMNNEVASRIEDAHNFSTDFTIRYFKVHNFLKIRDFEANFEVGDKVLLTGLNGSGKSTFLNSLFAALTGNVTWSHYVGKFDEEVYTEIKLEYNGHIYTLRRGSGLQWLRCDELDVPYKNRNDFGGVVVEKLPFLPELGILFQRPEVGTLFEGISSDAKLCLVSKIYHLEYLDQLYATGEKIKKEYVQKLNEAGYNLKNLEQRVNNLSAQESQMSEYSNLDGYELKAEYDALIQRQQDAQKYQNLSKKALELRSSISAVNNLKANSITTLNSLNKVEHENRCTKYENLVKAKTEFDNLNKEIASLSIEIDRIKSDLEKLRSGVCPRCHQSWVTEQAQAEINRLDEDLRLKNIKFEEYKTRLEVLQAQQGQFDLIPTLKSQIDSYTISLKSCSSSLAQYDAELDRLNKELAQLELPEKVEFTEADLNKLLEVKDKASKYAEYLRLKEELDQARSSRDKQQSERDEYQAKVDELGTYNWYVCKSGPIYRSILETLCESWSNDFVQFSIFDGTYRGNDYLDIKISYLKGTEWQDYSVSSSGEKSYMDILFIKAVTSNAGFLILDEFLRHMDTDMTERALDEIKSMNTNLFILSSFNPNLYFANRNLQARYIKEDDECQITMD